MDTTLEQIVEYWTANQSEIGLSVDWAEAKSLCWRCAHKRKLQRCHIVPRSLGGSEDPSNLVLLCAQCHSEAPNVDDPDFMWTWLRAHASCFYGMYWYERGVREYEFIYGEKPFVDTDDPTSFLAKASVVIKENINSTSTHWGQGKINPSTVAWLLRKIVLETDRKI